MSGILRKSGRYRTQASFIFIKRKKKKKEGEVFNQPFNKSSKAISKAKGHEKVGLSPSVKSSHKLVAIF